eukprot:m.1150656 g.1150656  ORF g.1150656 m.1150656 type:complete len:889 (-) comp24478_c0_seq3:164-2830(-)
MVDTAITTSTSDDLVDEVGNVQIEHDSTTSDQTGPVEEILSTDDNNDIEDDFSSRGGKATQNLISSGRAASYSDEESDYCETDLELDAFSDSEDFGSGLDAEYRKDCSKLNVVPVSCFVNHVLKEVPTSPAGSTLSAAAVTVLNLSHRGLGDMGAVALAHALEDNDILKVVNLTGNQLESRGAIAVAKSLSRNTQVVELILSDNGIGHGARGALRDLMANNSAILRLDLSHNSFDDADAPALGRGIAANSTISYLSLAHNGFEASQSGSALGQAIAENGSIQELDLSWNKFRSPGSTELCVGCGGSRSLQRLHLAHNGVGDDGAKALAGALKTNSTLTYVDIGTNSISVAGARHMAVGLTENQSLKTLVLAGNAIEDDGILALRDCLSTNRSLVTIDCRRVPHSAETAQTMWRFTQRSVDLHEKLVELDEMMKEYDAAQARCDRFQELTAAVDGCDAALTAALEGGEVERCGSLVAHDDCNREELAQMTGSDGRILWAANASAVDKCLAHVFKPNGAAVQHGRQVFIDTVWRNNDVAAARTAAQDACVAHVSPDVPSAQQHDAITAVARAAKSGVCAVAAAVAAYRGVLAHQHKSGARYPAARTGKVMASAASADASAAASATFRACGGIPYLAAQKAYAHARHNYPNDETKAMSAAKEAFLEHEGDKEFDPVAEIRERSAIVAARSVLVKEFPERQHFNTHEEFIEAKDACCALAAKEYKKNFGKIDIDTATAMMKHFDHEKEQRHLLEQAAENVVKNVQTWEKEVASLKKQAAALREQEMAAGTYPDFDFKLDRALNDGVQEFVDLSPVDAFERAIDLKDLSHFEFFNLVDENCSGQLSRQELENEFRNNRYEMTPNQQIGLVYKVGLAGDNDVVTYKLFMTNLYS